MNRRIARTFSLFVAALGLAAAIGACATSGTSPRWVPYAGCNANQCRSWYEECAAECINRHEATVTECENKCRANVGSCESSCGGSSSAQ